MKQDFKQLIVHNEKLQCELCELDQKILQLSRALQHSQQDKQKLESSVSLCKERVHKIQQELEAKQYEAADLLRTIGQLDTESRFGADRIDSRICAFKAYENTLSSERRSKIRGMVRDKIKVRNVRLANMLAVYWGFDKLCMVLVDGQETLKTLSRWEEESRVFFDLLDISDYEHKLEHIRSCITAPFSSANREDDPALVKFEFKQTGTRTVC